MNVQTKLFFLFFLLIYEDIKKIRLEHTNKQLHN